MKQQKSLAINYFYNLIKTLCGVLFPVITFSYASRVLGADGLGKVSFSKSYIAYFIMIAMLGINQYGTREAAKVRDNKEELSRFTVEVLIINLISTLFAYILLFSSFFFIETLQRYRILLLINSVSILLSGIGMEWLYQALEEYRYITIRSLAFQFISLFMLIVFVKNKDDVVIYCIINVISSSGSLILNFFHAHKYIVLFTKRNYDIKRHLEPMLWLFAMAVSIELYTVLDSTMLGFIKGDRAVGLYTAAIKVNRIVNTVITALGVVMIPRLSYYISQNDERLMYNLIQKGYNYMFMMSIPASIGLFMLSDDIICIFSGSEYHGAGFTMRILTAIIVLIPFSVMTNNQILVPMGKEKLILLSTCIGAITNIICNSFLIPRFAENGAAVATVIAEGSVALVCFIYAYKILNISIIFSKFLQYWVASIPIIIVCLITKMNSLSSIIRVMIAVIISGLMYALVLKMLRNEFLDEAIDKVKNKVIHLFQPCD